MATSATLQIVVDPTPALSGIARLDPGFERMIRQAREAEPAMRQASAGLRAFGRGSGALEGAVGRSASALETMTARTGALAASMRLLSDTANVARAAFDVLAGAGSFASSFVDAGAKV